ncbi:hypothetical protein GRF59_11610 [Paenibacillus sp. HJL G12]|uniref:Uncharacterized protein n=1 Tax=Paenibacillus dendrobii TaxID=2691084 RepID=A0A7X3IKH5_9BACL|nr:hypothetical protein [Paenibacillus dendrobii]MWV44280.1 hypothetical protein [Paenibacillus dendrobii]
MKKTTLYYIIFAVFVGLALLVQYLVETHQSYFGRYEMTESYGGTQNRFIFHFDIDGLKRETGVQILMITGDRAEFFEPVNHTEYEYALERDINVIPDQILVEWKAGHTQYAKRIK